MVLEERYVEAPRGRRDQGVRSGGGRRQQPPRRREPPHDWDDEAYEDEPAGRRGAASQRSRKDRPRRRDDYDVLDDYEEDDLPPARRRGGGKGFLMGCYKLVTILSALIVFGYLAFQIAVPAPEPSQPIQELIPDDGQADANGVTPLARRDRVYTVLLAATDAEGYRTDTMMVMTYDVPNQKVGVVSIPRDTLTRREQGKNPKLVYGPGGVEQRKKDIAQILGIPIDYYIQVNIQGFVALVDYLDGVDFYIPCDMDYDDPIQKLSIHFKEGMRHLNGTQAMQVARFRKNNDLSGYSDVGRTQTQQQLLLALAKKVISWGSLTKINGFVEIFNEYVSTDLKLNDMLYFASQGLKLDVATGVQTLTLEGRGDGVYHGHTFCYELDPEKTLSVVNELLNPYNQDLTLDDIDLMRAESYQFPD